MDSAENKKTSAWVIFSNPSWQKGTRDILQRNDIDVSMQFPSKYDAIARLRTTPPENWPDVIAGDLLSSGEPEDLAVALKEKGIGCVFLSAFLARSSYEIMKNEFEKRGCSSIKLMEKGAEHYNPALFNEETFITNVHKSIEEAKVEKRLAGNMPGAAKLSPYSGI